MKNNILVVFILLFTISYSQSLTSFGFPGKRIKDGYFCEIDSAWYNVGDIIEIASPQGGNNYSSVIIYGSYNNKYNLDNYKYKTAYRDIFGVEEVKYKEEYHTRYKYAHKDSKGFKGKIRKIKMGKYKGKNGVFALISYGVLDLAIILDDAIERREVLSKSTYFNENFIKIKSDHIEKFNFVSTFNSNFKVDFIRAYGDESKQKAYVEFRLSHGLVDQLVSFNSYNASNQAFDYDGNNYKDLIVINSKTEDRAYRVVVPNKIQMTYKIEIPRVLSSTGILSVVKVGIRNWDKDGGYSSEINELIFRNVKLDWNYLEILQLKLDSIENVKKQQEIAKERLLETTKEEARKGLKRNDLDFKLLKVSGNKKEQKVVIEWLVVNKGINIDKFYTEVEAIYDNQGNEIVLASSYYGATKASPSWVQVTKKIIRDVPVKVKFIYAGVPPESSEVLHFELPFTYHVEGRPYNETTENKIVLKNAKIDWY